MLQQTLKSWTMSLTESFPAAKVKRGRGKKGSQVLLILCMSGRREIFPCPETLGFMTWICIFELWEILWFGECCRNITPQLSPPLIFNKCWGKILNYSLQKRHSEVVFTILGNNTSEPSWACRIWRDLTTMCWFFLPKKNSFTWPEAQGRILGIMPTVSGMDCPQEPSRASSHVGGWIPKC